MQTFVSVHPVLQYICTKSLQDW